MGVCFPLKADVVICLGRAVDEYPDDPFNEVPQVEEDIQHLPHLQCVDVLVLCYH